MDITTRDGNKRHHTGKIGLNTFGASLILEGPIKQESDKSKSTVTYLVTAKNSYLSKSWPLLYERFYPSITNGLPFDFLDLYGKLSFNSGTGSKINFFGFRFDDQVKGYQSIADYHWNNYGAGTSFMLVTGSSAILDGTVAYSKYSITLDDGSSQPKYSEIGGFNANMQITNFFGINKIKYGLSIEGYNTDYQFVNRHSKHISQHSPSTNLSLFATYKWNLGRLLLDPGIRLVYYASLNNLRPEPRLAAKFNATDDLRFKFAGGLYSQIFLDARSDNDIVNLFSGFLTGSSDLNLPSTFLGEEVTSCVQTSRHAVFGIEYELTDNVTLNAEFYYKSFDQLLNANRDKLYDDTDPDYRPGGTFEKSEYLTKDYIIEQGVAKGIDLSIRADLERLYLWATYSLGFVERTGQKTDQVITDESYTYNPHYDRRHTVNLLATYALGEWREWEVSGRWTFGSGFPFTQTQGIYEQVVFSGSIVSDYTRENGEYNFHYAELYKGRLPAYHRLDLGIKRKFSISKRSILELSLSATNVYSRQNIFYFNRTTYQRVNQLPLLVCFGATMTF